MIKNAGEVVFLLDLSASRSDFSFGFFGFHVKFQGEKKTTHQPTAVATHAERLVFHQGFPQVSSPFRDLDFEP
jgi:hypothetical protein